MKTLDTGTKTEKYIEVAKEHKDTPSERDFKYLLLKNDIQYQSEVIFGKYRVDFLINRHSVEILGGYHNTKKQRAKDRKRSVYLLKHYNLGIKEITNKEVKDCYDGKIELKDLIEFDFNNYVIK